MITNPRDLPTERNTDRNTERETERESDVWDAEEKGSDIHSSRQLRPHRLPCLVLMHTSLSLSVALSCSSTAAGCFFFSFFCLIVKSKEYPKQQRSSPPPAAALLLILLPLLLLMPGLLLLLLLVSFFLFCFLFLIFVFCFLFFFSLLLLVGLVVKEAESLRDCLRSSQSEIPRARAQVREADLEQSATRHGRGGRREGPSDRRIMNYRTV